VEIIKDPSLVLNLPLYEPDGVSFISRDAGGYPCAADGAEWKPAGRYFGGDDFISLPLPENIPLGNSSRTVEVWAKPVTRDGYPRFLSYGVNTSNHLFGFLIHQTTGKLFLVTSSNDVQGDSVVTLNEWHHLAVTISGVKTASFYIDGQSDGVKALASNPDTLESPDVRIGSHITGGNYFNGTIGELRFYSRALTLLEIRQNYLATRWRYR
jgi:hypothetical protein